VVGLRILSLGFALQACARTAASVPRDGGYVSATPNRADGRAIQADIAYLASDALEGRGTGTPGNDSAAAYIARRFAALGLRRVDSSFEQHFVAHPLTPRNEKPRALATQNVVALLPGTDAALHGEFVVVGAHFDHLGRSSEGALDPDRKNVIRHGADDNASGTAAVLELARLFAARAAKRSLLFVAFSGEEMGLLGSEYFVTNSPLPLDSVVAMVNFDMVGRLRDDKLIVYGVATATELPALLDSANQAATARSSSSRVPWRDPLRITALGDGYGPSDHSSFYARSVPVLHFFTDLHEDYHRAGDVVNKINAAGEAHVVDVAEAAIRAIANRPSRLSFVRSASPAPVSGSRQGSDVYLGSIPDMSNGGGGLRLTGVRTGSPAEQAGLAAGDVIVEFGGHAVKDLYDFSDALYSHRPGDAVSVIVLRKGDRKQFTVHLGKRG
jgi:hypothetical protein